MSFEFLPFTRLTNGEIELLIDRFIPENSMRQMVPTYLYRIIRACDGGHAGRIDIRIGMNENIYYGGNIGYTVFETFRGSHYAAKACALIKQVGRAHGMGILIITCNPDNIPSRKTAERVGAKLIETVDLPEYNMMYLRGERAKCIYEWHI